MKFRDTTLLLVLVLLAAWIWLRDSRWLDVASDTLPILAAIPIFIWLRAPWRTRDGAFHLAPRPLIAAAILFPLGMAADSTLLLAAGWTALLWSWISCRFTELPGQATRKLLVLPLLAFPWVATDFERLGWWFRLSGAGAAEHLLRAGGFEVLRRGTYLTIDGFAVSVEPACSGLNGLQAMLVAGTMLAYLQLRHTRLFWWNLPLLVVAAWTANLGRLVFASGVGASLEADVAARWVGPLHSVAGWFALCAMFGLCWTIFAAEERATRAAPARPAREKARRPWLEMALLGYAVVRCRDLFSAWFSAPFDALGWVAFAIWLLPLAFAARRHGLPRFGAGGHRGWFAGAGLALTFLGDAGDVNVGHHVGLALILIALAPRAGRTLWACGAVAWLPALGWAASRAGLTPQTIALARVALALGASMWSFYACRPRRTSSDFPYVDRHEIVH